MQEQDDIFNKILVDILPAISKERLAPYHLLEDQSGAEQVARYLWNISLCEALYPSLHALEIALRNSIQHAASNRFGTPFWFEMQTIVNEPDTIDVINRARERLKPKSPTPTAGQMVAALDFGFWTRLFHRSYEGILWPYLLEGVFPNVNASIRTRKVMSKRFNSIRDLRNRAFHHEPIWKIQNPERRHNEIVEALGWINPPLEKLLKLVDRFDQVNREGHKAIKTRLADAS